MIRVTEVILWKYPDARFTYQGDGVQIKKHTNGDDECSGLTWLDDNINKPTKAQIDSWRANAEEAYKWEDVRAERDKKLASSDHVMLADFPLEDKSDWEAYRQALRDIPEDFDNAEDVEWPEQPSG